MLRLLHNASDPVTRTDADVGATEATSDEITVCVCSYRRPELLARLLDALAGQRTDDSFTFSCAVVDNDASGSARTVVERLRNTYPLAIRYSVESTRNLAMARNRALTLVTGNLLAFIDDDEKPSEDWLMQLLQTLHRFGADAVLGPVRPEFQTAPPAWIIRGRVCERESYATGTEVNWKQTRTGNVLMRRTIVVEDGIRFDPAYGTGGEDVDFFRRAARAGRTVVWCEEAPVYEVVPNARLRRRYYLKRALLQGRVSLKYATERRSALGMLRVASKDLLAIGCYTFALPFLFLIAEHLGMRVLIKDCHHTARLLAILGVPAAGSRDF